MTKVGGPQQQFDFPDDARGIVMCCILVAPMAGCAALELADLCAYGRRVMPN